MNTAITGTTEIAVVITVLNVFTAENQRLYIDRIYLVIGRLETFRTKMPVAFPIARFCMATATQPLRKIVGGGQR